MVRSGRGLKLDSIHRGSDCPVLLGTSPQAAACPGHPHQPGGALPAGKLPTSSIPPANYYHRCLSATVTVTQWCPTVGVNSLPRSSRPSCQITSSRPTRYTPYTFKIFSCCNAPVIATPAKMIFVMLWVFHQIYQQIRPFQRQ